jgi:hypothetical protein
VTPLVLQYVESPAPMTFTLKKKGFKDQPLKLAADKDHEYVVPLLAAHHSSGPSKPPKGNVPVVAAPAAPEPKPEPKPAGKLRDLKDPFAN